MNELTIKNELAGLDASKAEMIQKTFDPMVEMLNAFETQYADVMAMEQTPEKSAQAKRLRLDISRIRTEADKVRKEQKAEYLRAGNAIQGVYNILKFAVEEKETALKDVENYYALIEAEKAKTRKSERENELSKFDSDGSGIDLGGMADDVWINYLTGVKTVYDSRVAAEQKAEADRIAAVAAEKTRQAELKEENLRLAEERRLSDLREKAAKAKLQKEREATAEKDRILREAREAEDARRQAEAEKIRLENESILKAEREAREKIQREAAAEKYKAALLLKESADKKAEEARKAASAPDKDKLTALADTLESSIDSYSTVIARSAIMTACQAFRATASKL